jgi:transposase InsO family protein
MAPTFVKQFHEGTHSGKTALETTLAQHFYVPRLSSIAKTVCERCVLCVKNNPRQGPRAPPYAQSVGETPLEDWIVDFSEMPGVQGYRYLLVFICSFSGWVEAFPTWTEKVQGVTRCLLKEIIPQFGIPVSIESDNRPASVAEVVQLMGKGLGITWKLHMVYHPQSSGKVEHMNRTLKSVRKTRSGDTFAVGSVIAHSITEDKV